MASFMLICDFGLGEAAKDGLADGAVYSPAAFGLHTWLVYKSTSPRAYWTYVIFYAVSAVALFVLVIFWVRAAILMEPQRKSADQKNKHDGDVQDKRLE
jgi:phosphotransferase system  glucose/maltose/N-acetylglucosamine-specific IIC component